MNAVALCQAGTAVVRQEVSVVATTDAGATVVAEVEGQPAVVVTVGIPGPAGSPGAPGPAGGAAVQRIAATSLSALRAVYELNGVVRLLSADDALHIDFLLGITLTAAQAGEPVNVQRLGVMEDGGWSWTPGRVFLGVDGALTQAPPTSGYDVLIGSATSPTRIALNFQDPIALE
ncbi:hypothetical protein C8245_22865 [Paracidovorax avenae]|uniref:hypothetical protein n=1 Tax=Paracidovorax avenae TaxID=80867 RepID=UPI000D20C6E0|nr:hypothetical protein [Paracidovorax avenae]AVS68122.1 hypothetical protein C8245_22865 [Paracidovorax avenae]